jgi:hypothetical protein
MTPYGLIKVYWRFEERTSFIFKVEKTYRTSKLSESKYSAYSWVKSMESFFRENWVSHVKATFTAEQTKMYQDTPHNLYHE